MEHSHSLFLNLIENYVECFICKERSLATTALSKALGGAKVEVVKRVLVGDGPRDVTMVCAPDGQLLASLKSVESGVISVMDLTKDHDLLFLLQKAVFEACGIANIREGEKLITYTEHG